MKTITQLSALAACGMLGSLTLAACDIDVPDLNNRGLPPLEDAPTAALVNSAATGLLIQNRNDIATEPGYIDQLGILGREAYNFDSADPRYLDEVATGPLNKASPFGGAFWAVPYANILQEDIMLASIGKVTDLADGDKAGVIGFTETIQALDYLKIIVTHEADGAVIDPPTNPDAPLAPFVSQSKVYAKITGLLDDAQTQLTTAVAAGDAFTFALSNGFSGFDKPSTFLKFNRAIRARVAVYLKDYATALTALNASFIDDKSALITMTTGVYYSYGTAPGDTKNGLTNPNIWIDPLITMDADPADARYKAKNLTPMNGGAEGGRSATQAFAMYQLPAASVALIRNEELILLKAEVLAETGDLPGATTELNLVRVQSGGLTAIAPPATLTAFITALLYEREFSLLMEGHRWVDLRRFQLPLPLNDPMDVQSERFPVNQGECDARPGEPACMVDTTGFIAFE